ncbi:MAG: SLC13 family permease [Alphaproteobacteria bacterium]|nr:SLC13 family permease [Alphaproteobacteria bacterium]MCW5741060.1 SLC13 family permease [Alphaproteobacteria bacterium]
MGEGLPPNIHAAAVMAVALIAFVFYSRERIPLQTTSLGVLVALVAGFSLFPFAREGRALTVGDLVSGFGHEALVAICGLMILGRGLVVTGALRPLSRQLARAAQAQPRLALLYVLLLAAGLSAVINDTPVVILMLPVLIEASRRVGRPPSGTLLPMNYAVLVGGTTTTIGTSTNLLVVSIAADMGVRRFAIFDFTHVAAIAAVVGLLYLWLVLPRLLPERASPFGDAPPQIFEGVLYVREGAGVGRTLAELRDGPGADVRVLRVVRGEGLELVRLPDLRIEVGDRLHVRGTAPDLHELGERFDLALHDVDAPPEDEATEDGLQPSEQRFAELVVTDGSVLAGTTLRESGFSSAYSIIAIGLHRAGEDPLGPTQDIAAIRLRPGDILLVQGLAEDLGRLRAQTGLLLLDRSYDLPRTRLALPAMGIMALVIGLAAFRIVPIAVSALGGVLAMLLIGCLRWRDVGAALSLEIVLLIAASLALGAALTATGATDYLAGALLAATRSAPPWVVLVSLMAGMALFSNFVSNSAAAAVGTPIAVSVAHQLGVAPEPLVLAILFGANFSYVTPMAYQTNVLVMSAAGYRFSDFVRGGLPLALLMLAVYGILLPVFFPF